MNRPRGCLALRPLPQVLDCPLAGVTVASKGWRVAGAVNAFRMTDRVFQGNAGPEQGGSK